MYSSILTNLPWFGKNDWLINYTDSIEAPFNCPNCRVGDGPTKTIYQIPINAIVYYNNSYPDISNSQIEFLLNEVNEIYEANGVLIRLYLRCSIKHINDSKAFLTSMTQVNNTLGSDNEDDCLNIHFTNFDASLNLCGIARLPHNLPKRYSCAVNFNCGALTVTHEIGHNLGLPHTFNPQFTPVTGNCRNNCFQECVSRTRVQEGYCFFTSGKKKYEVNGDCFCDTHADINEGNNYNEQFASCFMNNGGIYNVSSTNTLANCLKWDNYGDQWYPQGTWFGVPFTNSMNNIMSYWSCKNQFTKMQRGAMYYYTKYYGLTLATYNNNNIFYSNIDVDGYENDNYYLNTLFWNPLLVNIMTVNTRQYHTFHHSYNPTSACDIDWVYFQNISATAKPYVIQTQEVIGKPKPDTKITLYSINTDGTLGSIIATNDNISGSNLFSKITTGNLAAWSSFAIKIENNITSISDTRSKGHYYLRIDACYEKTNVAITGSNSICSGSQQYTVSNIPINY